MVGRSIKEEPGVERRKRSRSRSRSPVRRSGTDRRSRGGESHSDKMVYISNIPYDVRWMDLKDMVREKAGEVAFVEMLETSNGKSKGAAVVEFKDRETAQKCIDSMHRMEMKDRQIVVKEIRDPVAFFRKVKDDIGVDFLANRSTGGTVGGRGGSAGGGGGRGRSPPGSSRMNLMSSAPAGSYDTFGLSPSFLQSLGVEGPLCNRVFVANLPYNIQSGKIREVFSLAGKVCDVDLQLDKEGKSKGLAVVEFTHPIEAVQSISMLNNQRLLDRSLNVKMDRHDKPADNRRPGELPSGLSGIGMGLGANGAPLTNIAQLLNQVGNVPQQTLDYGVQNVNNIPNSRPMEDPFGRPVSSTIPFNAGALSAPMQSMQSVNPSPQNLMQTANMNNIPNQNIAPNIVQNTGFGSLPSNPSPFTHNANVSSGTAMYGGVVGLPNQAQQSQANYDNRPTYNAPQMQQQQQPVIDTGYNQQLAVAQQMQTSNSYDRYDSGRNMNIQRQAVPSGGGGTARTSRVIIIRNLPSDYTWQMVRDRLRGYGDIEFADIIQPGVAKIRFKAHIEAERAMANLTGMSVEGRLISIDYGYTD